MHTTLDTAISLTLGVAVGLAIVYFTAKRRKKEERES